jgi:hypothetical protein
LTKQFFHAFTVSADEVSDTGSEDSTSESESEYPTDEDLIERVLTDGDDMGGYHGMFG